jgi:hypothetical protein
MFHRVGNHAFPIGRLRLSTPTPIPGRLREIFDEVRVDLATVAVDDASKLPASASRPAATASNVDHDDVTVVAARPQQDAHVLKAGCVAVRASPVSWYSCGCAGLNELGEASQCALVAAGACGSHLVPANGSGQEEDRRVPAEQSPQMPLCADGDVRAGREGSEEQLKGIWGEARGRCHVCARAAPSCSRGSTTRAGWQEAGATKWRRGAAVGACWACKHLRACLRRLLAVCTRSAFGLSQRSPPATGAV